MKLLHFALLAALAGTLNAQELAGDWHGALRVSGADLRLVLHVSKIGAEFNGSMDSIDQGAMGIPLSELGFQENTLKFRIAAIGGSYEGKLQPDGSFQGNWTQGGGSLPLSLQRGGFAPEAKAKPAKPSDIDGAWLGSLDAGGMKLRLVFHIVNTESGLTATMDSIDQGAKGIPVTSVVRAGASLKLAMKQLDGVFEGKISDDLSRMEGSWTQLGNTGPLALTRMKDATVAERRRPQNPAKPYPYLEQEVLYPNKSAGISLAGTLTIPKGTGPFPAVVLITGSGQQDRDESLLGHKPFLVLADYLTRKGIAVLRVDDRGIGGSGGNFGAATTADFATDVEAGISYLKTRPEVNVRKIGLIGHSEGGVIAPMVAARNPDVAFIVMMAGTGVTGDQILAKQQALINLAMGMKAEDVRSASARQQKMLELVKGEPDNAALAKKFKQEFAGVIPDAQLDSQLKTLTSPWMRYFLSYDPAEALRRVKCPVLAINGEKDLQVPPSQNLPAIRKSLAAGGNPDYEVVELPGLNHLFQTAKTGSPGEYVEIEETISPVALEKIANWVARR